MAYQALLFCPEEKTARTVTQVLAELEFGVEPCTEPFAAVKKLMGQHFDAIVVDCDNEQNATLLFKSARNSTSNQASLAVAIVEGQAGVAKAFRIGANLVLTKPINVEQSKGTLRVARGLLRKGEPGKVGATAAPVTGAPSASASASAVPAKPLATRPMPAAKPAAPLATGVRPAPTAVSPARPNVPSATAKSAPVGEIAASPAVESAPAAAVPADAARTWSAAPGAVPSSPAFGSGSAASAPAPAREAEVAAQVAAPPSRQLEPKISEVKQEPEAPAAEAAQPFISSVEPAPPSFTFGGANTAEPASGAGKKAVVGLVAAVLIAAAAYAGWSSFGHKGESAAKATTPSAITAKPQPATEPARLSPAQVNPTQPQSVAAAPKPDTTVADESRTSAAETRNEPAGEKAAHAAKTSAKTAAASALPAADTASDETSSADAEEPAPLVVKGGSQPRHHAAPAAADSAAPSMIGMSAPASEAPISNIVADETTTKPVLEQMKVSSGVAQGLIVKRVPPEYPRNALMMRIEGAVDLMATISKDGEIKNVKVLKGDSQLSRAAVQAVKQWKYKPYLLNGEPVEIQTQITIDFKLPR